MIEGRLQTGASPMTRTILFREIAKCSAIWRMLKCSTSDKSLTFIFRVSSSMDAVYGGSRIAVHLVLHHVLSAPIGRKRPCANALQADLVCIMSFFFPGMRITNST